MQRLETNGGDVAMSDDQELSDIGRASGARNELVRSLMRDAITEKRCPFCSPRFEQTNSQWVIDFDDQCQWNVWHSPSPYAGTSYYIMLAPKVHALTQEQLTDSAQLELTRIVAQLRAMFGFTSYSLLSRQGDPQFNSATVFHLHYHIIVSSGTPATADDVPIEFIPAINRLMTHSLDPLEDRVEWLDGLRDALDVYRESLRGRSLPIRAKLSNKIGENRAQPE